MREQLIHVLTEAAEIEHNLLCSYLYAAFSMKRGVEEGLTSAEEMAHLALVNNLLVFVGGSPHFNRPNFPVPPGYHPAGFTVRLTPFDADTLEHFLYVERPAGAPLADGAKFVGPGARREHQGLTVRSLGRIIHPCGWYIDGIWMAREAESEKITINLGFVDLGQIDLLVEDGFYSNRTDFIRTAIRNQLSTHREVVKQSVARREMVLGLQRYTRRDLEKVLASGEQLQIQVLGLATIDDDVTPQLARQAIASIAVLGALRASPAVKAALADRTR